MLEEIFVICRVTNKVDAEGESNEEQELEWNG